MNHTEDYQERIVAYVDILGFKHIIKNSDLATRTKIIKLLTWIKGLNGDISLNIHPNNEGGKTIKMPRSGSSFSDHIVISYPLGIPNQYKYEVDNNKMGWDFFIMQELESHILMIMLQAMDLGLLVRGAITKGNLYHQKDIIFGQALVDAYTLESEVANVPRIIVSADILDHCDNIIIDRFLTKDIDGIYYLNYLNYFFTYKKLVTALNQNFPRQLTLMSQIIKKNVSTLMANKKTKEMSKWVWFSNYFSQCLKKIDKSQLEHEPELIELISNST